MVQSQETTVAPPIEPQEVTSPEPSISEGPQALPAAIVIEPMSADTLNLANGVRIVRQARTIRLPWRHLLESFRHSTGLCL